MIKLLKRSYYTLYVKWYIGGNIFLEPYTWTEAWNAAEDVYLTEEL